MTRFLRSAALTAMLALGAAPASAQTFNVMQSLEAPHFDAQRTTWGATGIIALLVQDTLVALDWDAKTPIPHLAKSWTVSPDGRTYTFQLRDDVTFCSGKKFTSDDVVYTFTRLKEFGSRAPFGWRAGRIKEVRATGPYTVEYELTEPFSELLLQLTMWTNVIINKDSVEQLGKDYGIAGLDGTGPWCFVSWKPRTETILRRHDAYRWGPSMYQNKGPVKFDRLVLKIMPEESTRLAAMLAGQFDYTSAFPRQFISQAKAAPNLEVKEAKGAFGLLYFGFKQTRDMVSDPRVREAMSIAINRADINKGIMLGHAEPMYTYVHPDAQDFAPKTNGIVKEDVERAKRLLDEAGWKMGADGIREKDGVKLAPKVLFTIGNNSVRPAEAIQGYLRKIGIDWRLNALDSSISPIRMNEQDYEIWSVTVPYMSAGDLMNLYFDSRNIPTPNRMNWKDPRTDELLAAGRMALTPDDRAKAYMEVQELVMNQHLWMPVLNVTIHQVTNKRLKNTRPHMLYNATIYKALDFSY
ncbi:MAG: ABC transporter substrate-binding protein [Acetobacteraceae bacterium]